MAKITKETAEYIARLACLEFPPDELERYTQKFTSVLTYVEKLKELDTGKIEPMSHAVEGMTLAQRDDLVKGFKSADEILNNAPKTKGRLVEVPKVLESE